MMGRSMLPKYYIKTLSKRYNSVSSLQSGFFKSKQSQNQNYDIQGNFRKFIFYRNSFRGSLYQNFTFWPTFRFFTIISILYQNFYLWPKFRFLIKISISDQNFDFRQKFRFFVKISIFFTKMSIFDQNFGFWPKFKILANISILTKTVT